MSRFNFILFIIFLTFLLPGPPATPVTSDEQERKVALFKEHLYRNYHSFQNSTYDQNFGNLTGYMLSYEDVLNGELNETYPIAGKDYDHWFNNQTYSILPDELTQQAQQVWALESQDVDESRNYYTNISSYAKGRFETRNTTFAHLPLELPLYLQRLNENLSFPSSDLTAEPVTVVGNVTTPTGDVEMSIGVIETINRKWFNERDSKIKLVNIDFELADDDDADRHTIETKGFYFVDTGNLITMTNSAKFMSFYGGIQRLAFTEENFENSKNLTLEYFDHTYFREQKPEDNVDISFNYLTQLVDKSVKHCEYVAYFHLNKVNLTKQEMRDIDEELTSPIGRPINFNEAPLLNFTGFMYSPDCGVQIEVPSVTGVRREIKMYKYHKAVIIGIVLLLAQIFLTVKQMNYTSTPSTISRISFWSITMMSLVDGSLSMMYLVSSAILNSLYLPLTVSAFLSFILASMFEMRFMISIYMSQINERTLSLFTALQGRPMDDDEGEPRPEPQRAEPQDEAQVSGAIYTRFFFTLIVFVFVVMNSLMWPKHVRQRFEYVVFMVLNSYWLPQAYRNVVRGSHRSFKWWFIIGTTTVRTIPLFYIFCVKSNVFDHHYDPTFFSVIFAWLAAQLFLLFLQGFLGARFMLPKKWLPQTYNYHPALTEHDLEAGFGVEHMHPDETQPLQTPQQQQQPSEGPAIKQSNGTHVIDCAICMNEVEIPILKSNLDQAATFLQRRAYMVTPCRHIFHTQCLEAWMKYKLQCPVCRNSLPPL